MTNKMFGIVTIPRNRKIITSIPATDSTSEIKISGGDLSKDTKISYSVSWVTAYQDFYKWVVH